MTGQNTGLNNHWVTQPFYPSSEADPEYNIYQQYYDYSSGSYAYYGIPYLSQNIFYPVQHQWIPSNTTTPRYGEYRQRSYRFRPKPSHVSHSETVERPPSRDLRVAVDKTSELPFESQEFKESSELTIQNQETSKVPFNSERKKKWVKAKEKKPNKSDEIKELTKMAAGNVCENNCKESDKKADIVSNHIHNTVSEKTKSVHFSTPHNREHQQRSYRFLPKPSYISQLETGEPPPSCELQTAVGKTSKLSIESQRFRESSEFTIQSEETSEIPLNSERKKKGRKTKKKKLNKSDEIKKLTEIAAGNISGNDCNEPDKKTDVVSHHVHNTVSENTKSVHFSERESKKSLEDSNNTKIVLNYSRLFTKIETKTKDQWPKLQKNENSQLVEAEEKSKQSFAEKAKKCSSLERPFLDWRDQRKSNDRVSQPVQQKEKMEEKEIMKTVEQSSKEKSERRQRKKLREKERKRRIREEKALAEKLAPKSQKIKLISSQVMEKYKQSTMATPEKPKNVAKNGSNVFQKPSGGKSSPVIELPKNQEKLMLNSENFPKLGRLSRPMQSISESESEWETTEVVTIPLNPVVSKNVRKKDSIQREEKALAKKLTLESKKNKQTCTQIAEKNKQSITAIHGKLSNVAVQKLTAVRSNPVSQSEWPESQNRLALTEEDFPELQKPSRSIRAISESESEWETTEVVTVPIVEPKNVKRKDPIQLNLFALIQQKQKHLRESKSKTTGGSATSKKKKNVGLVANILDRNAPVLSRGKIRNKKRKPSEIRRALLKWKEKKKQMTDEMRKQLQAEIARQSKLHSKKFREYCDQMLTDEIDANGRDMLFHLRMFQDRAYQSDPIKGRMRKRLVAGLREVTKQVERSRVKIIFLAPDIERCAETGGLDEAVEHLLKAAHSAQVPIVYTLSRRKIGRVLKKNVPVSCCGILNFQGTEETWNKLKLLVQEARAEYKRKAQQLGLMSPDTPAERRIEEAAAVGENQLQAEQQVEIGTGGLLDLLKLSLKDEQVN